MRQFISLLCALAAFPTVQAEASRTCRIVFLNAPAGAPETLHLFDGKTSRKVGLPRSNFSPVYKLTAGPIVLRMLPSPETDAGKIAPEAPSATLGAGVIDFYLVVSSDPDNTIAPVKLEVIDATELSKGRMLWINRTSFTVEGQIGGENLTLEGNSQTILSPPATAREDYKVSLSYHKPDEEDSRPICDTKWKHDPAIRTVCFIVKKEGERTPRVIGLRDTR